MSGRIPRIAILGAGRAGCSLAHNLAAQNFPVQPPWTRSEATAERARAEGVAVRTGSLSEAVAGAELVFVAVSDGAVSSVVASLLDAKVSRSTVVAHLAGSLDLSVLQPLEKLGVSRGSLHPLVSLATRRSPLAGAWCAVEGSDARATAMLEGVAQRLSLRIVRPRGDRARYHAAACLVGNYPQVLMQAAVELLEGCGIGAEDARASLGSLLRSAADNAATLPGSQALTGPIARGDVEVVRRHLAAIAARPDIDRLYRAGATLAAGLAHEAHPAASDEIVRVSSND